MCFPVKILLNLLRQQECRGLRGSLPGRIVCSIFAGLKNKSIAIPLRKNADFFFRYVIGYLAFSSTDVFQFFSVLRTCMCFKRIDTCNLITA